VRDRSCGDARVYLEFEVRRVACRSCGRVKREQLPWLADNPFYTKRFAFYVGQRCRSGTIRDVARELKLDWKTVKDLEKQYMREQLRRARKPAPRVIGIDEIAIRKGHTYRIVVSDLERGRPIWFGWKAALKWQRLKSYEKFAAMIDRHWEGIAAYCREENKVSLGFVEGLNTKIRVIQRRAYGLRDEEYLRLKVLTCMLPAI
jgi:transposase